MRFPLPGAVGSGSVSLRIRSAVTCSTSKPLLEHAVSNAPCKRVDVGEHRRSVGICLVNNDGLVFAARSVLKYTCLVTSLLRSWSRVL